MIAAALCLVRCDACGSTYDANGSDICPGCLADSDGADTSPAVELCTYARLRSGAWGVRANHKLVVGQRVVVRKRSGKEREETIAKIVWHDHETYLAAIE